MPIDPPVRPSDVVLFQGDSITDAGRDRDRGDQPSDPAALGWGYARYASAALAAERPGVTIYNRGIGGDRVTDLERRWDADVLMLRPTVLSVLIGVNDTWHSMLPEHEGVSIERYETLYGGLLARAREAAPGLRVIVAQPFVLTCGFGAELPFEPDITGRREAAQRVAEKHADAWLPYQEVFDAAIARGKADGTAGGDPCYWAGDGVHPSMAGHQLMASAWLEAAGLG
ncbi:MAG: GDSL-type esterase/lipase family protein [Planctomycetota bacterium]